MGKKRKRDRQASMWVATADLPTSAGHPFYARLNRVLDEAGFDTFVEAQCARFYADGIWRPSLAPGRYFWLLLLGYFEGLDSERAIAWRASDSLSIRQFLDFALHEAPPDHSTLSRTRRLIDLKTHQAVFTWVLQRLADAHLVEGHTIGIDATTLEANAAMRSIVRRDTGDAYEAWLTRLAEASGIATPTRAELARFDRKRKKKGSNDDWTHPHDPDAKITKMKDGRTHLAHTAEHAVDLETGAIVGVTVQDADDGDTTTMVETLLEAAAQIAAVEGTAGVTEVVGDKGYHSNETMVAFRALGIRSYVSEPDRGRRNWKGKAAGQQAVYANRRRIRGSRGQQLLSSFSAAELRFKGEDLIYLALLAHMALRPDAWRALGTVGRGLRSSVVKSSVRSTRPLPCGADHAGEDLLGLRAPGCPIAATDFTVDDGGANGVFGTPVGGLHLGRPQEGEHGSELAVEMGGEALGGRQGGRRVEESPEAREQAPAGHGEAVLGDRVRLPSITECEGVGEDRLHAGRPRTARMIRGQGARSAHQVRQTRLMQRRRAAAIRRPPVSHQDAVKVGAQHLGRLVEAAPVANAIHRSLRRGKRPQPVPHRADPPAGLVGAHDGTAADLCAQRGVGRGGHAGRAMQHLHEPPGRHRQPEALPQECGHLGEWHADLLVQARNQCDGARPQVDVGGPHRVRGLQRMATLHAAPALCALPDGHMKAPDDRPDDGEIFLVLRRHALQCHHPAAPRTRRRERGLVGRINPGGNRAARPAPIPAAGSSARLPAVALGPILGERRGLPEPRPPRGCKLLLQARVLPLQSIVLTLQALVLTSHLIPLASQLIPLPLRSRCHLPQPRDLLAVLPDLRVPIGGGTRALIGHAILMTDSCE